MIKVRSFQMDSFLPASYEEELVPALKEAQEKLQTGSGAGGSFTD